ncbi:MAG: tetratricopeptide repeat protein, partial [Symploca sp. SIO2B6]|nr:tetratricopeptide repeat protein [Symploca sp. SIO2B6]
MKLTKHKCWQHYFPLFGIGIGLAVILVVLPATHSRVWGNEVVSGISRLSHDRYFSRVEYHADPKSEEIEIEAVAREHNGHYWYQQGDYLKAINTWQQAIAAYIREPSPMSQARVWSNISLAYQNLGQWNAAQTAIDESLLLLHYIDTATNPCGFDVCSDYRRGLAQALNTQGRLFLSIGKPQDAFQAWSEAVTAYRDGSDSIGRIQAQLNLAQATQELGHHRQAIGQLTRLYGELQASLNDHHLSASQFQHVSRLQPVILRQQGDLYRLVGEVDRAQQLLQDGLAIAQQQEYATEIGAILFSLGQTHRAQQEHEVALELYQQPYPFSPILNFRP